MANVESVISVAHAEACVETELQKTRMNLDHIASLNRHIYVGPCAWEAIPKRIGISLKTVSALLNLCHMVLKYTIKSPFQLFEEYERRFHAIEGGVLALEKASDKMVTIAPFKLKKNL
jgi:hypothetical protein